jgi:hypothetical protein
MGQMLGYAPRAPDEDHQLFNCVEAILGINGLQGNK